jgi:hypothetical protein
VVVRDGAGHTASVTADAVVTVARTVKGYLPLIHR